MFSSSGHGSRVKTFNFNQYLRVVATALELTPFKQILYLDLRKSTENYI